MGQTYTPEELNTFGRDELVAIILAMQGQINTLSGNVERLIEQIRLSDQQRFGRQTEKLDQIAGQMSFFNEAEASCDEDAPEPGIEETVAAASKLSKKPKKKGNAKRIWRTIPRRRSCMTSRKPD